MNANTLPRTLKEATEAYPKDGLNTADVVYLEFHPVNAPPRGEWMMWNSDPTDNDWFCSEAGESKDDVERRPGYKGWRFATEDEIASISRRVVSADNKRPLKEVYP